MKRRFESIIPTFVIFDHAQFNEPLTQSDAAYILRHEIDLFEEGEDGALSAGEITKVRAALRKVAA